MGAHTAALQPADSDDDDDGDDRQSTAATTSTAPHTAAADADACTTCEVCFVAPREGLALVPFWESCANRVAAMNTHFFAYQCAFRNISNN